MQPRGVKVRTRERAKEREVYSFIQETFELAILQIKEMKKGAVGVGGRGKKRNINREGEGN